MDSAAKPETILTVTVTPAVKRKQWKWRLSQLAKEEEDSLEGMQEEDSEEVACSAPGQPQEQGSDRNHKQDRNHPVPIPEWVVRYAQRLQLLLVLVDLHPG